MHVLDMKMRKKPKEYFLTIGICVVCLCVILSGTIETQAESSPVSGLLAPMRQDALKFPPVPEVPRTAPLPIEGPSSASNTLVPSQLLIPDGVGSGGYDPSGRRDPFAPIIQELQPGKTDTTLPPLQRVTLTELNLIAIVWGAYGYTAMVQTPEGHGYTVRRGTRIGQNNGVVSAITERGIIVQERFTDVYGKKQEREYVKLLHPKEGSE
jgi:type IV pilus assembly protein PilP